QFTGTSTQSTAGNQPSGNAPTFSRPAGTAGPATGGPGSGGPGTGGPGTGGPGTTGPGTGSPGPTAQQGLRSSCNLTPSDPAQFVSNHVIVDIPASVQPDVRNTIAAGLSMTKLGSFSSVLTGRTLYLWQINSGIPVAEAIVNACQIPQIAGIQADLIYRP